MLCYGRFSVCSIKGIRDKNITFLALLGHKTPEVPTPRFQIHVCFTYLQVTWYGALHVLRELKMGDYWENKNELLFRNSCVQKSETNLFCRFSRNIIFIPNVVDVAVKWSENGSEVWTSPTQKTVLNRHTGVWLLEIKQEAQLMLRNPRDAFRGQSRSHNMVTLTDSTLHSTYVRYGFLLVIYRNFLPKTSRFSDIGLQEMSWPRKPG